jgi:hypothetical protein
MDEIFSNLRIEVTKENKKEIDRKIHEHLGIEYKNCSATWKVIKELRAAEPDLLIERLKSALK